MRRSRSATAPCLAAALILLLTACLGNSPPGYKDYLYSLVVEQPTVHDANPIECAVYGTCEVSVDIVDLTDHNRVGGFVLPGQTNFAGSLVVDPGGFRIYVGEQLSAQVQAYQFNGTPDGQAQLMVGRAGPWDMVLTDDGSLLYANDGHGIARIETTGMTVTGQYEIDHIFPTDHLGTKIAITANGDRVVTTWGPDPEDPTTFPLHVIIVDASTMGLITTVPIPPGPCTRRVADLVMTPVDRLLVLDPGCNEIYQVNVATPAYLPQADLTFAPDPVGSFVPLGLEYDFDYVPNTDKAYVAFRWPNGANYMMEASLGGTIDTVLTPFGGYQDAWVDDVVGNVDGVTVYYAFTRHGQLWPYRWTALAALQTGTQTGLDYLYTYPVKQQSSPPDQEVKDMQIVRWATEGFVIVGDDPGGVMPAAPPSTGGTGNDQD